VSQPAHAHNNSLAELAVDAPPPPARGEPLPAEGEGGFSQTWWPICLSCDVAPGQRQGFDFLGGRVVVFRDAAGSARVLSGVCPHLGADLGVGDVHEGTLRCAFHHWQFDADGRCVRTGVGDRVPRRARLFRFPTLEKHGIVWAFNGLAPTWTLPEFEHPEHELVRKVVVLPDPMPVDPWVLCCNTPDFQHIKALHGITFAHGDPHDEVEWTDHSMLYDFAGQHRRGEAISNRVGIFGTSLYYQATELNGRWFGFLAPFGLPRPGVSRVFMVVAARKDSGSAADVARFLDEVLALETRVVGEDVAVMQTIRFRQGTLTPSDRTQARFFDYLRAFPRAHPAAEFMR
jgi:nitrite reductase/ring-hydroxylating ferredoxin subunit